MAREKHVRLTDAAIARLRPREREYTVWDGRLPGLGVRVRPSGGSSWIFLLKTGGGTRKITLGPVMLKTVEQVRRECHVLSAAPGNEREPEEIGLSVPSFRGFVADAWKKAHFNRYKPSTQQGVRYVLAKQLLPAFGSKPLDRISPAQIRRWFDAFSQTAPGGANHALDILQQIMNFAVASGHIDANPARGVKRNRRQALTRFLSREEIGRLHKVLDEQSGKSREQQADIIRLLLLTGCRRSEIVQLRWSEVRDDTLSLADSKTGTAKCAPQRRGSTHPGRAAEMREPVRVSFTARPGPSAQSRPSAMVSGPPGSRDRGCPPSRPAPYAGEPRGDERGTGAGDERQANSDVDSR